MAWGITTTIRIGQESGVAKRDLDIPVSSTMHGVLQDLHERGHTPLVVGGAVRDALMGIKPKDIDVEVYGTSYDDLTDTLSKHGKVNVVGKAFGVAKFIDHEGNDYDFSLPRRDNKTGVGHKDFETDFDPDITPKEAASRRDFTMNSMAYSPITHELHDYFGGEQDLQDRVLKHTSDAFSEDPLRVLRGMQFSARYGMSVHPATADLARSIKDQYSTLPKERVGEEFMKLATKGKEPGRAMDYLRDTGWDENFPALHVMKGTVQEPKWHPEGDLHEHTKHTMNAAAKIADREGLKGDDRATVVLGAMCHDMGKPSTTTKNEQGEITSHGHDVAGGPIARQFLDDIGIKPDISDKVQPLVESHMQHLNYARSISSRTVRRLADRLHPATIKELSHVMEADHSGRPPLPVGMPSGAQKMLDKADESHVTNQKAKRLVEGRDVMPYFNNEPGRHIGEHVKAAYEAQLNGEFDTREQGLAWLHNRMSTISKWKEVTAAHSHVTLYHGTNSAYWDDIQRDGLQPRTYLTPHRELASYYAEAADGPGEPMILSVDAHKRALWVDGPSFEEPVGWGETHSKELEERVENLMKRKRYISVQDSLDTVGSVMHQDAIPSDHIRRLDEKTAWKSVESHHGYVTAMPRDDAFLNSLKYHHTKYDPKDEESGILKARDDKDHVLGYLTYGPTRNDEYVVGSVNVHPDHRLKGLATKLWNLATEQLDAPLHHSPSRTDDGFEWSETVGPDEHVEHFEGTWDTYYDEAKWWENDKPSAKEVKIAMPRDEAFLGQISWEYSHDDFGKAGKAHLLTARHPDDDNTLAYGHAGQMSWSDPSPGYCGRCFHHADEHDDEGCLGDDGMKCDCDQDGGWVGHPHVSGIETNGDHQRKGLATEMWKRALKITPNLDHEPDDNRISGAGMDWIESLASVAPKLGSWRDVRNKAIRLRNSNLVRILDAGENIVTANVTGDHDTYEVVLWRQFPGSKSITTWDCNCEWGYWAFRRQHTFVGRMCSHALATLYQTQSLEQRRSSKADPLPRFLAALKPHEPHDDVHEHPERLLKHMLKKHAEPDDEELDVALRGMHHDDLKVFHQEDHDFFSEHGWGDDVLPGFDHDDYDDLGDGAYDKVLKKYTPKKKKTPEEYVKDVPPREKREGDDFEYDTRWFNEDSNTDVLDTLKHLTDSYPVTKKWFRGIRVSDKGPTACVVPNDHAIWLPPSGLDKPGEKPWAGSGSKRMNHLIAHEFGHVLHASIQSHECGEDSIPDLNMDDLIRGNYSDEALRHPDSPATWAIDSAKEKYPKQSASGYAEKDDLERFAEGISDHWTNQSPAPQSKHIGKMIDFLYHKDSPAWKQRQASAYTPADVRDTWEDHIYAVRMSDENRGGVDRDVWTRNGRPFSFGVVNLLDGAIEEVHSWDKAKAADWHHSSYVSPEHLDDIGDGTKDVFWMSGDEPWSMNGRLDAPIRGQIKKQIERTAMVKQAAGNSKLTIYAASGRPVTLSVEVADDAGSIAQGLMYRPMLPMMSGMVFIPQYKPSYTGFWMKNVSFDIDIAFWDRAGVITEIISMQAGVTRINKPRQPWWGAVEVNKGFFKQWGIIEGCRAVLKK